MWFRRHRDRSSKADEALVVAEQSLQDAKDQGKEVREIAEAFREFRERNHFAEQLEAIILQRRGRTP